MKYLMHTSRHLCNYHSLKEQRINPVLDDTDLKLHVEPWYSSLHIDKHLNWESHIECPVSNGYGKLSSLCKMMIFKTFSTSDMLAKSLYLPKIDINDYVYLSIEQCQLKKFHQLQKAVASFVIQHFAHTMDILRIIWLHIAKTGEINILQLTFKAIYEPYWQEMNKLDFEIYSISL